VKTIFRNRPALLFCMTLCVCLTLREHPINALLLLLIAVLFGGSWTNLARIGFAAFLGTSLAPDIPDRGIDHTTFIQGNADVRSVPRVMPGYVSFDLEIDGNRLNAVMNGRPQVSLGDTLYVTGLAKPFREGAEATYLTKGLVGRFTPIEMRRVTSGPSWLRMALEVRSSFLAFTAAHLRSDQAALVDALCFNVDGGLDDETRQALRNTGTIHIISASGMHVFVLALVLNAALGLLPVPRPVRLLILGGLLLIYAAAAGLQPAILRSVFMAMAGLTAYLLQRESDLLSALAVAGGLYLIANPIGIYDMGFQLSYLTVAAFGLFGSNDEPVVRTARETLHNRISEAVRTSGIAFLATAPVILYYFGLVALTSIPANLIIAPAVLLEVVAAFAVFAADLAWADLGAFLTANLVGPLADFIQWVLSGFAAFPQSTLSSGTFSAYWLVLAFALIIWRVEDRIRPA